MPKADDERRVQVAQAIADFAFVRCRRAKVIVTCRVKQYEANAPWRLPDLPTYELADFDNKQIREFVGHWFTAVKDRIQNADDKRDSLLRALGDRPELEELAPKPILLTQMALVHADNILPDSRVELYHECADLLLWKWERLGRQGQSADDFLKEFGVPGLRRPTIEDALYQAVYFAHQSGAPEIAEDLIRDQLTRAFAAHNLANN
jgi:predicted NACHT family NTPase